MASNDARHASRKVQLNLAPRGSLSPRRGGSPLASVGQPHAVSDAGLGHEVARALRIGLDLAPQLAHIDPQILRVGRLAPQLLQQKLVRQHLADMLDEQAQEGVLLGRELHLSTADLDDPAYQIDAQLAELEQRVIALYL